MTMTKKASRLIAVLLILVTVLSIPCTTALAASSGSKGSTRITVRTKANWKAIGNESITLKQSKVTVTYRGFWNAKKMTTRTYYPVYNVSVYNNTTHKTKYYKLNGASLKINLDRNASYTITVSYNSSLSFLRVPQPLGWRYCYEGSPRWWVGSACKASYW